MEMSVEVEVREPRCWSEEARVTHGCRKIEETSSTPTWTAEFSPEEKPS